MATKAQKVAVAEARLRLNGTGLKWCPRCGADRRMGEFFSDKRKGSIDGLRAYCKPCTLTAQRIRIHHLDPEWLAAQGDRCFLCDRKPGPGRKGLCVDHDHAHCGGMYSCGQCVRAMLCSWCNRYGGFSFAERRFKHDREKIARYFERVADYMRHGGAPGSPNRVRLEK